MSVGVAPGAPAGAVVVDAPSKRSGGGRVAALDGLRGLAVAAVVVFHLERLQGGFLGVDLFFVLSGFLITSLLLKEVAGTGRVGLGGFWARRARRLLPALFLVLVGVSALLLAFTEQAERARFRGDALATLGYVANWHRMGSHLSYWDMFTQPSPLDHMWSLAIEEQFYLFWPLVVLGLGVLAARRRARVAGDGDAPVDVARLVGVVAGVGAVASLVALALTYHPGDTNVAYFSTPTRLGPTLLGAALAAWASRRPVEPGRSGAPSRPAWDLLGILGLAVIGTLVVRINGSGAGYYRGGLALFALASLAVVVAITVGPNGLVSRALSFRPLALLGIVSYGVYLWHWPVIVYATPDRTHLDGWALDALRVGLTLGAAALSYVLVEQPIRRGALPTVALRRVGAGALAGTLAVCLVATWGTPASDTIDVPQGSLLGVDTALLRVPADVPPGATRVLMVGDSGPSHWAPQLVQEVAAEHRSVAVAFAADIECSPVYAEGPAILFDGRRSDQKACNGDRRDLWRRLVDEFHPDVVVQYYANVGLLTRYQLDGKFRRDCESHYDDYLRRVLDRDAEVLTAGGATLAIATSHYIATLLPGTRDQVDCRNATYRRVAADGPHRTMIDLNAFVLSIEHEMDPFMDPVHLSDPAGRAASRWLLPQLPALLAVRANGGR